MRAPLVVAEPAPDAGLLLAEVAVARLCHDLSGVVGAIGQGLEFGAGAGAEAEADEALQLAADAAGQASARLRLARALWTTTGPLSEAALMGLAAGLPQRERIEVRIALEGAVAPGMARLVLACMVMGAESLRGAGGMTVSGGMADGVRVMLQGARAAWPEELAAPVVPDGPRLLMPYLAAMLARRAGMRLVAEPPGGLAIVRA